MKSGNSSKNSSSKLCLKGPKLPNLCDEMYHRNKNFQLLGKQEDSYSMTFQNPVFLSVESPSSPSKYTNRKSSFKILFC